MLFFIIFVLTILCQSTTSVSRFQNQFHSSLSSSKTNDKTEPKVFFGGSKHLIKNSLSHSSRFHTLVSIRGGKNGDKDDVEDEDSEGEDSEDEDSDVQLGGGARDNPMLNSITDLWKKTPPITKAYISTSAIFTLLAFFFNKNVWPEFLHLKWNAVLTQFQFWRPFTAFFFYGPLGLNYILTIQFVWTYMAQLEKLSYKSPGDFFVQMVFGAVTLVALYTMLGISPNYLGHNLSTYLVYIWARVFEGSEVNVMDLFNLKAEILPWFFCLQTFILEGEVPFADMLGIVVGHLYHYLSKQKILVTPKAIQSLFDSDVLRREYLQFKDDFE